MRGLFKRVATVFQYVFAQSSARIFFVRALRLRRLRRRSALVPSTAPRSVITKRDAPRAVGTTGFCSVCFPPTLWLLQVEPKLETELIQATATVAIAALEALKEEHAVSTSAFVCLAAGSLRTRTPEKAHHFMWSTNPKKRSRLASTSTDPRRCPRAALLQIVVAMLEEQVLEGAVDEEMRKDYYIANNVVVGIDKVNTMLIPYTE